MSNIIDQRHTLSLSQRIAPKRTAKKRVCGSQEGQKLLFISEGHLDSELGMLALF